eukprot:1240149-Amphidinium_carterae.1
MHKVLLCQCVSSLRSAAIEVGSLLAVYTAHIMLLRKRYEIEEQMLEEAEEWFHDALHHGCKHMWVHSSWHINGNSKDADETLEE